MKREDIQKKHEEDLQRIRNFRLLDDDFMSKVFEDKTCAEILLRIILQRKDLKVKYVYVQQEIKNLQGRSIRLDILAEDTSGKLYNVEVQRSDKGASRKRARHNSSLLDANITDAGEDYEKLNSTYVIFITENDILKSGLPIYHIDRTVKETGESFEDGAHIIYVNSQIKNETELGKLMHDFLCTNAEDMNYSVLADRVRYFKEDEKGVSTMCKAMEDMRNEAHEEGRLEGKIEGKIEGRIEGRTAERRTHIREMLLDHVTIEKIKQYTSATDEEILEVQRELELQ